MDWTEFRNDQVDMELKILNFISLEFSNFYEKWKITPNYIDVSLMDVTALDMPYRRYVPNNVKTEIELRTE